MVKVSSHLFWHPNSCQLRITYHIYLKNFIFILEYLKFVNKSTILATGKMEADTLNFVH